MPARIKRSALPLFSQRDVASFDTGRVEPALLTPALLKLSTTVRRAVRSVQMKKGCLKCVVCDVESVRFQLLALLIGVSRPGGGKSNG